MPYLAKLREILKPDQIATDDESLTKYASDASGYKCKPEVVARPRDIDEVVAIVALAYENGVAVTARGGGSGIRGGAVPTGGGILISFELMDRMVSISRPDLYAEVEPGMINRRFRKEIESRGLIFPVDPASEALSTIGGNVADQAVGIRSFKYGTIRDHVVGLEFVTPQGEVLSWGGRTVKNVVGYDLTRLFVGSQGTLGLTTKVILRLLPAPESRKILAFGFDELASACDASSQMVESMTTASAIEIMDRKSIEIARGHIAHDLPTASVLLVEMDGCKSICDEQASKSIEIARRLGGSMLEEVEYEEESRFWKARQLVFRSMIDSRRGFLMLNIRVSPSRIWSLVKNLRRIGDANGLLSMMFGHSGSGSIHFCFLLGESGIQGQEWISKLSAESMREIIDSGGDLLEEIRISMGVKPFIPRSIDACSEKIIRGIKAAIDQKSLFNPGKLING
ncbi:MAG: FAD-binding oxidoreductase [bacterium]